MRAIVQDEYGDADVLHLEELPIPTPADDEVVIRVRAAGLEMSVWHLMTGRPHVARLALGLRAPRSRVRGADVAGIIHSVGSKVTAFAVGDEVFGSSQGSLADYAIAKASKLAAKPAGASFEEAAALPVSGSAALLAVQQSNVAVGQRVLVIGAAGHVGQFLVQLAKARGAHVTGVCSARSVDFVRSLGADAVVDRSTTRFEDSSDRYDVIIDTGGNRALSVLRSALSPKGTLVIVGAETDGAFAGGMGRILAAPLMSMFVDQRLLPLVSSESATVLDQLRQAVDAGELRPRIARTWPLEEAPAAVRELTAHRLNGRLVVTVD